MTTVIVGGAVANKAGHGGSAWVRLSWAEAFARLGFEVLFAETLDPSVQPKRGQSPFRSAQPKGGQSPFRSAQPKGGQSPFKLAMETVGLDGSAALLAPGGESLAGISREELLDRAAGAELLVNISGHLRDPELLAAARVRAFVDLDPGYTQVWHEQGHDTGLAGHEMYFTVGANVGTARCPLPTGGLRWRAIRQPVVLERWPVAAAAFSRFTTVASWRGAFGPLEWGGRAYGVKAHEFRPLAAVPRAAGLPFEAVLDIHAADAPDAERLEAGGWTLRPPSVTADPGAFARYVRGSGAEFSAAQGVYVHTRSGWCSDRTVRYLASGRPALVQDTGQGDTLPTGEGLITFSTPEDAARKAREIVADHARHGAAARRIAEEHFAPRAALRPLLEAL